jgi:hypothetical protein
MSTRPTTHTIWATNVNYAGGPDVGTSTKTAPSAGRFADGWRKNDVPPAQEQNYWQNQTDQWIEWFDNGSIAPGSLSATTPTTSKMKVLVEGRGWYQYWTTAPFGVDGFWEIDDSTTGGNNHWEHELLGAVNLKKIAAIGPTPGEAYPTVTPADRINKANIDHGYLVHDLDGTHHQYTTTSATAVTFATLFDVGTLAIGDIVKFEANVIARGSSSANFTGNVVVEYSQNGGGAWTLATDIGGAQIGLTANNLGHTVAANFFKSVSSAGDFQVRLRGYSDGANTLVVDLDSCMIWVTRP